MEITFNKIFKLFYSYLFKKRNIQQPSNIHITGVIKTSLSVGSNHLESKNQCIFPQSCLQHNVQELNKASYQFSALFKKIMPLFKIITCHKQYSLQTNLCVCLFLYTDFQRQPCISLRKKKKAGQNERTFHL